MRAVTLGTLAVLAFTIPASAQMMCSPAQQAQAQTSTPVQAPAMMCGGTTGQSDDPMADKPATPQRQTMCSCCRGMAMMGSQSGSIPGMRH